jgi:cytochrome P450
VCPGATLARLEGQVAVEVLLDRLAELRPVEGTAYPPLPGSLGHLPVPARLVPRGASPGRATEAETALPGPVEV